MDLMQVFRSFPDRDACSRYLEDLRWGADPRCAHCGSKAVARTTTKTRQADLTAIVVGQVSAF